MPRALSPSTPSRLLLPALWVALAYTLTGWVSLVFAIPLSYATPIFPAAGIALVAVLVYGPRMALAVAVGAVAVNLGAAVHRNGGNLPSLGVPLMLGFGAALQALAGAALVQRNMKPPLMLDSPRSIARFFGLGALLACLVNASIGTLAVWAGRQITLAELPHTWWTWWAGDALGVMVAAPVVLSLIGQPAEAWRPRRRSVAVPLVVGLMLLALATAQVSRWQEQRTQARFERDAGGLSASVDLRLRSHLDALDAMHSVYSASTEVDRDEFRRAATPWLQKLPSVQAIGWHERVARDAVPAFEAAVRTDGDPAYRVFDREAALTVADPDVIAMRYVEPRAGNESALGVNVLSIAATRQAIGLARGRDSAVATPGFRLTQERAQQTGVVIYRAVHANAAPNDLRGLVFVSLRMEDTLAALRAGSPEYLTVCLFDTAAPAGSGLLAGPPDCARPTSPATMVHRVAMPFAGRQWELRVHPRNGLPAETSGPLASDSGTAWLFSIAGLTAMGMLGALLLIVTGRTRRTEVAINERTLQLEHEVAERELTEQALRESEQRFRSIFNSVPIGVVYTDLDSRIRQPNAAFCAMVGYSEQELISRSVMSLTHRDDRADDHAAWTDLVAGRVPLYRREKRYVRKDGASLAVQTTVSLLRDQEGRPHRLVGLVEDVSEHLRLEEAERARESAEASNRAKSDFLSRMSHELRTPLNAMLGFAQLLELDGERMEARHAQWIGQIRKAGWHLLEMINDVLDLSRIESGNLKLQLEPLRLEPLLAESMAMVEPQARERRVHLVRGMMEESTLRVFGDGTRVKQILTNLLSNAIKYNREGGDVKLRTRRLEAPDGSGSVEIEVTDTGLGMNAEQLAQLFQPFNRLGRERGAAEGTGIGLVIAKLLAERLGGSLRVRSTEGSGSTFMLTLPLTADANADSVAQGLDTAEPGYHRRHVLYIEDNEINIEVMRGIFAQRRQVQLDIATTGLDGLAAVRTMPPDLILLDMHLPDIEGMTLLQHLQADERTSEIPVIVVSADALPAQIAAAMDAGASRYLTKPVAVEEMLAVLDEQLSAMTTRFG